jgi:hypothetical protein
VKYLKKTQILKIGNLLGFLLTIIINTLATTLPINGKNTGELSDAIPNLFVPIGLTFAIWGVIYLLLGIFALAQLWNFTKLSNEQEMVLERIGPWFIIASLANSAWILAWHYVQVPLSLIIMTVLLVSLLIIYLRLGIGSTKSNSWALRTRIIYGWPFSVYLGWITVATIANVIAVLVTANLPSYGLSEPLWTIIMIIIALGITLSMLFIRKDIPYALVVAWALLGIILKRIDTQFAPQTEIVITAVISLVGIGIGIILTLIRNLRKK